MHRTRVGGAAGLAFAAVGAVELALAGGPVPPPGAGSEQAVAYFADGGAAGAVAVLTAAAGALFLVFAAALRGALADRWLGDLAWGGALVTVVLAFAGQATQQVAWLLAGDLPAVTVEGLSTLVGFLFGFALVGGAILAVATGVAARRNRHLPGWLGALGGLLAAVALAGVAGTPAAAAAFPVFLVWLVATSVVLLRQGATAPLTDTVGATQ